MILKVRVFQDDGAPTWAFYDGLRHVGVSYLSVEDFRKLQGPITDGSSLSIDVLWLKPSSPDVPISPPLKVWAFEESTSREIVFLVSEAYLMSDDGRTIERL
jgi:hypothetical protein